LAEKVIKKVIKGSVVWEQWRKVFKTGGRGFYYKCEAEIKNTGVSNLYNLIIIAAIYDPQLKKAVSVVTNRLQTVKLAGYMIIDNLKPDENMKVDILVNIPDSIDVIQGKRKINNLEKYIENERILQKIFLIYDTAKYDDKVRKWFKGHGPKKTKISKKEWQIKKSRYSPETHVACKGIIRNTGTNDLKNFEVVSVLIDVESGSPLRWILEKPSEYEAPSISEESSEDDDKSLGVNYLELSGAQTIDSLKKNENKNFNISFKIPEEKILRTTGWSLKKIDKAIKEEKIIHKIFVNYEKKKEDKSTYKNLKDQMAIIQEVRGKKKVEIIEQNWELLREKDIRYKCTGRVKNKGTLDVENLFIICSIMNVEHQKPISWETSKQESENAVEIIKIKYLKSGEEIDFESIIKFPKGNVKTTDGLSNEDIINDINTGKLKYQIELYYTHEDVHEEGMKRLNLGNTYFQLGNYKAALTEYEEGIKLLPKDKRLYFNSGLVYYRIGYYLESLKMFEDSLKKEKRYSKALYFQGIIYAMLKSWAKSINSFRRMLTIEPDNAKIHYNISCIYFLRKQQKQGLYWLDLALKKNPKLIINQAFKDSDLKDIRKTEQFKALVKEVREKLIETTELET